MIIGLDLGSRTVKVLRRDRRGRISRAIFDTVPFYRRHTRTNRDTGRPEVDPGAFDATKDATIVSTGYGRNLVSFANTIVISEIEAHVAGVRHLTGFRSFILVDIGGQDTKVAVVRHGRIVDFEMNDRCAAGTGRFLETIATTLDMTISQLAQCSKEPVELTATCAIFSESEVIGKLVEGHSAEALAAGANLSVARRLGAIIPRAGSARVLATGGAARNSAVIALLGERLGRRVRVLETPEYTGALGCLVRAASARGIRLRRKTPAGR